MIYKYINDAGLLYLWGKIKAYITGLGYTSNVGTVTGVKMNSGSATSPDANGVVDLGTVITDISSKANVSHTHTVSQITDFPSNLVTGLNNSGVATAYTIKVVDSMPGTTDASTIYLVTGS